MKINIVVEGANWILDRVGEELHSRLDDSTIYKPREQKRESDWTYYTCWHNIKPNTSRVGSLFTHVGETYEPLLKNKISFVDNWFSMSEYWGRWLPSHKTIITKLGLFPHFIKPLTIGIIHRKDCERKGESTIVKIKNAFKESPIVFKETHGQYHIEELVSFMEKCDYVLCASTEEGGPMPLIEALAIGKNVICRGTQFLGYLPDALQHENVETFTKDIQLIQILQEKLFKRQKLHDQFSWDKFADLHKQVFYDNSHTR